MMKKLENVKKSKKKEECLKDNLSPGEIAEAKVLSVTLTSDQIEKRISQIQIKMVAHV